MKPTLAGRIKAYAPSFALPLIERVEKSPLGSRFAKGTIWSAFSNVVTRSLGLVTAIVITRLLGKELYGQVGMVQSTVDMFSVVGGLGLSFTATKHVAEFRRTNPARAGRIIAMASVVSWGSGIVIAGTAMLLAPWLASSTLGEPKLTSLLRLGACLLLFGTVNAAQVGSLSGFEAFKVRARVAVISGLFNVPVMIGSVYYFGVKGAVAGLIIGSIFLCFLNALAVRHETRKGGITLGWKTWYKEIGLVMGFSLPTMASSMILAPSGWVSNAIIANRPDGFAALGIYNAANQWCGVILFLPSAIGVVSMAIYSDLVNQQQWEKIGKAMWASVKTYALVLIVPVLALALAGPWVMRAYGTGFTKEPWVLSIRIFTAFMVALYTPIWPMLLAAGRVKTVFGLNLGYAGVFILLTYLLASRGATGLASAAFIVTLLYLVGMMLCARDVVRKNALAT